jgi:hypothetical protein
VGINYENSFVGIIEKELESKKIANLAISSYSPSIYYAKINYLLSNGFEFKEIIVFLDISDIRDDTICYDLKGDVAVRRRVDLSCLKSTPTLNEKIFNNLKFIEQQDTFSGGKIIAKLLLKAILDHIC